MNNTIQQKNKIKDEMGRANGGRIFLMDAPFSSMRRIIFYGFSLILNDLIL
jgi:hypothetical protein